MGVVPLTCIEHRVAELPSIVQAVLFEVRQQVNEQGDPAEGDGTVEEPLLDAGWKGLCRRCVGIGGKPQLPQLICTASADRLLRRLDRRQHQGNQDADNGDHDQSSTSVNALLMLSCDRNKSHDALIGLEGTVHSPPVPARRAQDEGSGTATTSNDSVGKGWLCPPVKIIIPSVSLVASVVSMRYIETLGFLAARRR